VACHPSYFVITGISLRDTMDYYALLLKFLVGGFVVAGTTVLTEQVNPKWGGILATAPIITTLAFYFVYAETNAATAQQLALNSFYFVIPTALFMAAMFLFLNRYTFFPSLGGAYLVWIVALAGVYLLVGGFRGAGIMPG
jgi:membrane protein GlpM